MHTDNFGKSSLVEIVERLELPPSAYEKAKQRYEDLGNWLGREESRIRETDPHIFPQGSFRLGTAIYPINEDEAYDLDLACKVTRDITKDAYTQENLKTIIGREVESYRTARGIKLSPEEMHRCWRLEYQDELSFHMDIVPCIPADTSGRSMIFESLTKAGANNLFAEETANLTVNITDDRHPRYRAISSDWYISNPEGYAKWFEERTRLVSGGMILEKMAQVDELPVYQRKTPLQRVVQLLKRHRDNMFREDTEVKPISIIITTIAAEAYRGESDLMEALHNILADFHTFVRAEKPRVPNPVDPNEDFADRWGMKKYEHLKLEHHFWLWVEQARRDFDFIASSKDAQIITEQAACKLALKLDPAELAKSLGLSAAALPVSEVQTIVRPPKPWGIVG